MRSLTVEQFSRHIERLINGEVTRKQLAKELETDMRTLNGKITELATTNPELYQKFIEKFPYRPKTIKVDVQELAIKVIRYGLEITARETGISIRTISRKVKELEKINPELYELYQMRNMTMNKMERQNFDRRIAEMGNYTPVKRTEIQEMKTELQKTIQAFEELVSQGCSKNAAAKELGYDGYPTIWKKYQELKRIETEERNQGSSEKRKGFIESIKVDIPQTVKEEKEETKNTRDNSRKGIELGGE